MKQHKLSSETFPIMKLVVCLEEFRFNAMFLSSLFDQIDMCVIAYMSSINVVFCLLLGLDFGIGLGIV